MVLCLKQLLRHPIVDFITRLCKQMYGGRVGHELCMAAMNEGVGRRGQGRVGRTGAAFPGRDRTTYSTCGHNFFFSSTIN